jgi:hypothetical protein
MTGIYPFADINLARRLERAEARGCRRFVEERGRLWPDRGACAIEIDGTSATFDGAASPITQTFGLGMFSTPTPDHLSALEAFFFERGAAADHEVSPQADAATLPLLTSRGYQPIEFTSVLFRPIHVDGDASIRPAAHANPKLSVRLIDATETEMWARTAAAGWAEFGAGDFMIDVAQINAGVPDARLFVAELEGRPIGTAVLAIHGDVAHLAGASTVPDGRQQGAQLALLHARLQQAAESGCDVALMGAAPGSGSQRNAERHGFRIAYTRIKWRMPLSK